MSLSLGANSFASCCRNDVSIDILLPNYLNRVEGLQKLALVVVGPLPRVRPRNGILALLLLVVVSLRSEFISEL